MIETLVLTPPFFLFDEEFDVPRRFRHDTREGFCFTRSKPDGDRNNQDAMAVVSGIDDALVLAVADGLGGLPNGAKVARRVVESLASLPFTSLPECIQSVNDAMASDGFVGGCTLAAVEIVRGQVVVHHVGDAGALVVSDSGAVRLKTVPHSPVGHAEAHEGLAEAAALSHPQRHVVSNMIGDGRMWIETSAPVTLQPGDTVVVASDGLWDNFFRKEIVEMVVNDDLLAVSQAIVNQATVRMTATPASVPAKKDDLSFIVFRFAG